MAMHVLQLGPYPPPEGGVSRNMLAIGDELRSAGHSCTYVATTSGQAADDGQNVLRPRSALELLRVLAATKFDVLHIHIGGEVTTRVLALCAAGAFFGRGRSVLTMHSGGFAESEAAKKAGRSSFAGMVFRRFSRVIAVNEKLADVFRRYGVADERVRVIPPFALQRPDETVDMPANLRDFAANHSPLLIAVGGLEIDYDPLLQIRAMKEVIADHPNAGLIIVGEGSMRAECEAAVAAGGHGPSILIAGNVAHPVTLKLMDEADLVLRTTLFDGDAISVREALFLGTPVVATDNGMRPDGVVLFKIGDEQGLVDAINSTLSKEKSPAELATSDTSNIKKVLELYTELA